MAEQALAKTGNDHMAIVEQVVIKGDLAKLTPAERVDFYRAYCESVGLNPVTRPFEYIALQNKLTLYPKKEACEQLRKAYKISIYKMDEKVKDVAGHIIITKTAYGETPDGRKDQADGVVTIKKENIAAYADAVMKAETKAKRRLTLSMIGLGFMTDYDDKPRAKVVVDAYGAIVEEQPINDPDEAIEGEVVDEGGAQEPKEYNPKMANESQLNAIKTIAEGLTWSDEQVNAFISMQEQFREDAHYPDKISAGDASKLIVAMQKEGQE